jgi:hypothetical protein
MLNCSVSHYANGVLSIRFAGHTGGLDLDTRFQVAWDEPSRSLLITFAPLRRGQGESGRGGSCPGLWHPPHGTAQV